MWRGPEPASWTEPRPLPFFGARVRVELSLRLCKRAEARGGGGGGSGEARRAESQEGVPEEATQSHCSCGPKPVIHLVGALAEAGPGLANGGVCLFCCKSRAGPCGALRRSPGPGLCAEAGLEEGRRGRRGLRGLEGARRRRESAPGAPRPARGVLGPAARGVAVP